MELWSLGKDQGKFCVFQVCDLPNSFECFFYLAYIHILTLAFIFSFNSSLRETNLQNSLLNILWIAELCLFLMYAENLCNLICIQILKACLKYRNIFIMVL